MSLFPSTLTGRILDDGVTEPPVIELQGISAGQLATVLTAYTPQTEHTANTAAIGVNAAAIAALQGQVAALPAAPDLTPYALASDLAAAEGSILANASGLVAVNTSLTQGLATKANQSALDALQVEVNGKSTLASVDLKLANHPTTAAASLPPTTPPSQRWRRPMHSSRSWTSWPSTWRPGKPPPTSTSELPRPCCHT